MVATICAIAFTGCSQQDPVELSSDVVAVFHGGDVRLSELETLHLSVSREGDSAQPAPMPGTDWREEGIRKIALRKALAAEAPSKGGLIARIEAEIAVLLVERMADELGWNDLAVTNDEIKEQYDAHPEQYNDPEKLRLQFIYFRAETSELTPSERSVIRAKIEEVRRQLLDGADFTAMARQHSESGTAPSGGWMMLKRNARVDPAFVETAWVLDLNEVSEVVDTANGFHILVARERFPALAREFEAVREFARKRALTAKRQQVEQDFVVEVGPDYDLVVDYEPLGNPESGDESVLIRWAGSAFTTADLLAQLPPTYLEHYFNHYFPKIHEFLDQVTLNRLLLEEARGIGLAEHQDVAIEIARIAEDRKAEAALNRRLQDRVYRVPDGEMRSYFEQNEKRYQTLRSHDLSLILLPPGDNLWNTLKFGEELVEQIRSGASFAELAQTHSIHPSATTGGRLEDIDQHALAKTVQSTAKFRRALGKLTVGETAPAMVAECYDPDGLRFVSTGVLVFRLDGITPPAQVSYEDAEMMVRGNYLRRNHSQLAEEVEAEILDEIDLEIFSDRLPPL